MNLDWLLSPITQYSILALGLISCLGFCISTAIRVRARQAPPSVKLSPHAQALDMHRRGDALPTIAAAIRVPQNEIELLLKIHGDPT